VIPWDWRKGQLEQMEQLGQCFLFTHHHRFHLEHGWDLSPLSFDEDSSSPSFLCLIVHHILQSSYWPSPWLVRIISSLGRSSVFSLPTSLGTFSYSPPVLPISRRTFSLSNVQTLYRVSFYSTFLLILSPSLPTPSLTVNTIYSVFRASQSVMSSSNAFLKPTSPPGKIWALAFSWPLTCLQRIQRPYSIWMSSTSQTPHGAWELLLFP
jgi:hypothetical protein